MLSGDVAGTGVTGTLPTNEGRAEARHAAVRSLLAFKRWIAFIALLLYLRQR